MQVGTHVEQLELHAVNVQANVLIASGWIHLENPSALFVNRMVIYQGKTALQMMGIINLDLHFILVGVIANHAIIIQLALHANHPSTYQDQIAFAPMVNIWMEQPAKVATVYVQHALEQEQQNVIHV